jgi:hypothetical protein
MANRGMALGRYVARIGYDMMRGSVCAEKAIRVRTVCFAWKSHTARRGGLRLGNGWPGPVYMIDAKSKRMIGRASALYFVACGPSESPAAIASYTPSSPLRRWRSLAHRTSKSSIKQLVTRSALWGPECEPDLPPRPDWQSLAPGWLSWWHRTTEYGGARRKYGSYAKCTRMRHVQGSAIKPPGITCLRCVRP